MSPLKLTTGDLWDEDANQSIDDDCHPEAETSDRRRSLAYIEQFRQRVPLGRAIRLKCGACMGGEVDQMPRCEVARAIDECGSCMCPLWPFRFGHDPWRPEPSEAQREARRERARQYGFGSPSPANFASEEPQERLGEVARMIAP
jgi:hypothetical protein